MSTPGVGWECAKTLARVLRALPPLARIAAMTVATVLVWWGRWWILAAAIVLGLLHLARTVFRHRHWIPAVRMPQRVWTSQKVFVRWRWRQAARACGLVGPRDAEASKQRPPAVRVTKTATGWRLFFMPPRGMSPGDVRQAAEAVGSAFGVPATVSGTVDVRINLRTRDPLATPVRRSAVPAAAADLTGGLPVAVSENGDVVSLQAAHTLILGATGSGKGGAMWAIVSALLPAADCGLLRLIGLDSKGSEVRQADGAFCDRAYSPSEHVNVLAGLVELIARRGEQHTGREFTPSTREPLTVVLIDEITSLTSIFDSKQKSAALSDLRIILSLGRSRGVLVVGAGQDPTKEAMALRNLFPQPIALRLRDATETRLVLGDGAIEQGASPHTIPVSSRSNGYASAGLAYVQDETGVITRCRFPYTSDDDLAQLVTRFADHTGHGCATERLSSPSQIKEVA